MTTDWPKIINELVHATGSLRNVSEQSGVHYKTIVKIRNRWTIEPSLPTRARLNRLHAETVTQSIPVIDTRKLFERFCFGRLK